MSPPLSPTATIEVDRLAEVRTILTDSRAGLEYAYEQGLPRDAIVRTSSPALLRDATLNTQAIDQSRSLGDLEAIGDATTPLTEQIYKALMAVEETADLALTAARSASLFQRVVTKAALLRELDFRQPLAAVALETGSAEFNRLLNFPWPAVLVDHPAFHVVRVPAERLAMPVQSRSSRISALRRARLTSLTGVGYWLARKLWERMPLRSPRGSFVILTENFLVKEAAFHLAKRGFAIRVLTPPPPQAQPMDTELEELLTSLIRPVLRDHLDRWVLPAATRATERLLLSGALADARRHRASVPWWREKLDGMAPDRPLALLTNYPKGPESGALHNVARERGLPVVAFQHGVSREISVFNERNQAHYENNSADLFVAYTERNVVISRASPFAVGRSIAVGLPEAYWRAGRYRRSRRNAPPIMYASTQLYAGNIQSIRGDGNDQRMAEHEILIIEKVLARIPHSVLYKTYPAIRYVDPDPVVARAKTVENIKVFEDRLDLRYMLPDARVLMTSRATSTLAWCLMSGKPLVFVDVPDSLPLRPEAREALEQAVFLFHAGTSDFLARLVEFLSLPINEIERRYAERGAARKVARDRFFQTGGGGAGSRAARLIIQAVGASRESSRCTPDGPRPTPSWKS